MSRKLLGIYIAVAMTSVLVSGSTATAATLKDTSEGKVTTLTSGTKIKAISGSMVFTSSGFTWECNENFLTGEVHRNSEGIVELTMTRAGMASNLLASGTGCRSPFSDGAPTFPGLTQAGGTEHWCFKTDKGADTFSIFGRSCTAEGTGKITISFLFIFGTTCSYVREAALTGTFTTAESHLVSSLSLTGENKFKSDPGNPMGCLSEIQIKQMNLKLYTDKYTGPLGEETWDDAASTAAPVFFTNP